MCGLVKYFFILLLILPTRVLEALATIAIVGNPSTLTINIATAGQQPNNATNNATTYNVSASTTSTITGKISANMPANVTLKVQLQSPLGGTSAGLVSMNTTAQTLVSNVASITTVFGLQITYQLSATVAAAQVTAATKTLTLTIQ